MKVINEWPEGKHLELTRKEIVILRAAYLICEKADQLTRLGHDEVHEHNSFSYAAGDLSEILENMKDTNLMNIPDDEPVGAEAEKETP